MTNKLDKEFSFKGTTYTYYDLKDFDIVKTYEESSHFDRRLIHDSKNDRLFLYEFYEYVDFSGGNDEIYTTYVLVNNESEANKLNKEQNIKIGTSNIFILPNWDIKITEKGD